MRAASAFWLRPTRLHRLPKSPQSKRILIFTTFYYYLLLVPEHGQHISYHFGVQLLLVNRKYTMFRILISSIGHKPLYGCTKSKLTTGCQTKDTTSCVSSCSPLIQRTNLSNLLTNQTSPSSSIARVRIEPISLLLSTLNGLSFRVLVGSEKAHSDDGPREKKFQMRLFKDALLLNCQCLSQRSVLDFE